MEKKEIILDNKKIIYILRKSARARRLRMMVGGAGLVVTIPPRAPLSLVHHFLTENASWILSKLAHLEANPVKQRFSHRDYLKNKYPAKVLVRERLEFFNKLYGYTYHNITIRNQTTRWGSCSRSGNLSFNFKILFLAKELQDYIIVHEICHLKEMNHSSKFWKLVAMTIPDYRRRIRLLKESGLEMQ